jgi:hypothetical protein
MSGLTVFHSPPSIPAKVESTNHKFDVITLIFCPWTQIHTPFLANQRGLL